MDHKSLLGRLEAALKTAQSDQDKRQAYERLLASYPLLFGYWLQYLRAFYPRDVEKWKQGLEACPALDLYSAFLKLDPNVEDLEFCVAQVGYYFQAAPIWDALLAADPSRLERVLRVPLYDYAKYFAQAREQGIEIHELQPKMTANINGRWPFESKITRPYFHVLPLEQSEIDNWNAYLDYQEAQDDIITTDSLYKRCLVSTALYSQFWLRYLRWANVHAPEKLQAIYNNSCLYLAGPDKARVAVLYSAYLELRGEPDEAKLVLEATDKSALEDFNERNKQTDIPLDEARTLWQAKQLDKHTYLQILRRERQLDEFFKLDVVVNGAPDTAKFLK